MPLIELVKVVEKMPRSRFWPLGSVALVTCLGVAPAAPAASFETLSQIYVFGDSYSEDGTAFELSTQAVEASIADAFILPADPDLGLYDKDGRWTNGPTAIEILAENLQLDITNYAVGGAKSGNGNYYSWLDPVQDTGFFGQIDQFAAEATPADPNALYFVFVSANDLFEFVDFGLPGTVEDLADETVQNIGQGVSELAALGAEQFLIVNSSDLDILPGVIEFGQVEEARLFTDTVNELLPNQLTLLDQQLDIEIALYDHVAISDEIRANPAIYGLTNVNDSCQPVFPVEPVCNNPAEHYFWDEYHPTERAYEIIGDDMTAFVGQQSKSVPEPGGVVGLMLLGTAGIYQKSRRNKMG